MNAMNGPDAPILHRMPRPTDTLRAEHLVVRGAIQVLRGIAEHVQGGGRLPAEDTATVLRFLREFLLGVHFRKESEVVWPTVAMRGSERCAALVGELLRLQGEAVDLVHSLVLFWEPVDELTAAERAGFAEAVSQLGARLERMEQLEERMLFAACDACVPPDDQLEWVAQFAATEAGRVSRDQWILELRPLARRWAA